MKTMIQIDINKKLHGAEGEMALDVKLSIEEGSFVALAGQSGAGKTTLLRVLAGLERASGVIHIGDEVWQDADFYLATQKRKIGFVFQDYALFENMSVEENLLFVKNDKALAKHLLELTELSQLAKRRPSTLSGGQQQRVSLCRAFMNRPKLLLMDEPLSALDPFMRSKLQQEILTLHREFGTTTIMVSHDPSEMYRLASRVVVLEEGSVVADGVPKEILLQSSGLEKFSFEGELLELIRGDVMVTAIVAIGQQLVEVVLSKGEAKDLKVGTRVSIATKAFAPTILG
jgi:molybdate transport system ATP-binding protein